MYPLVTSSVLVLAFGAFVGAAQRSVESFNFGWNYILGDQPYGTVCNSSATNFPINLTGIQCYGLASNPTTTEEQCACACENSPRPCYVWQWSPDAETGGCWIGPPCTSNVSNGVWVGAGRMDVPPTPPVQPDCEPGYACSPDFNDSAWRLVDVPHDFIVEGNFTPDADRGHGYLPFNISWYRKHFSVDAAAQGRLISLEFDGVYRASTYWLNGVYLGYHDSGYTSFFFYIHNLTDPLTGRPALNYGAGADNVLAVRVDALTAQEGWFYEGGGINRNVRLVVADNVSVVHWGVYAPAAVTGNISSPAGGNNGPQTAASILVLAQTDVANGNPAGSPNVTLTLTTTILDAEGRFVGSGSSQVALPGGGWARESQWITLSPPGGVRLWNTASPYLHTVATTVEVGGALVDAVNTTTGFRQAYFDPQRGFILNGFPQKLKGLSMHQDFAGCGTAVPARVNELRVATLAGMGATGWRTAHNPVDPAVLEYCDTYGLVVMAENRFINPGVQPMQATAAQRRASFFVTEPPEDVRRKLAAFRGGAGAVGADGSVLPPGPDVADPQYLQDAQDMVLRDRNHPSVAIWSLCNEGGCQQNEIFGGLIAAQFKVVIAAADSFRPITGNTEWQPNTADTFTTVIDVMAYSYNEGSYDTWHNFHPWKPVFGGESASCTSDRGYYGPNNSTTGFVNANDEGCVSGAWQPAAVRDFVAGNFAWTGFDYKGEPTPMNWPCINSHFGIVDIAGFKKDSYFYYEAWWALNASSIHVSPMDWTAPVPVGEPVDVYVYAIAPVVELIVNGVSRGNQSTPAYGSTHWAAVPFQPGSITAVGYGADGSVVATQTVETAGAPVALSLWIEPVGQLPVAADGEDVAIIGVAVVDAAGRTVPNALHPISWSVVSGPGVIYGTGSGNPSDHTPDKCGALSPFGAPCVRPAWMGLGRAIVRSVRGTPGAIVLSATAPGLVGANITIETF